MRSLTTPGIQNFYEEIVVPDPDTGHRMLAKGRNVIATLQMLLRRGLQGPISPFWTPRAVTPD